MRIQTASGKLLRRTTVAALAVVPLLGAGAAATSEAQGQSEPRHETPARLVRLVREATRPYLNINNALKADYGPFLGCVSGPEFGAMGVHYVNEYLVKDGKLDPDQPEALMYEIKNGRARLLGVEFIVDAATWLAQHGTPPVLEGQSFHLVSSPNRYGIPAFFELHVWAWKDNPNGTFVDWNPQVSCDGAR
jgi:hypothetical protein